MKNILFSILVSSLFSGCALEKGLKSIAASQYNKYLTDCKVLYPNTSIDAAMVERVGTRITRAITLYYTSIGKGSMLSGYKWEFNTIDSKEINAWCMPGGKVIVYSGLLHVTQNESALAIVMGHEIAHAICKHFNEGMSQAMINKLEGSELEDVLALIPSQKQDHLHMSFVMGSKDEVMSPWSHHQETEADKFGLIFAAIAGYDPREAITFCRRMSSAESANQTLTQNIQYSDSIRLNLRLKNLNQFMPGALKYYNPQNEMIQDTEENEVLLHQPADLHKKIVVEDQRISK
jgi:predicted Zn-dependent protease